MIVNRSGAVGSADAATTQPLRGGLETPAAPAAPLKTLPKFELTERSGEPFGSEQLRGKVWIADFIFTRCGGTCPRMTAEMAALQQKLRADPRWPELRLV